MSNTEPEDVTGTDLILYDPQLFPALVDQDPDAVMARFAERFKAAKTLDDLFGVLSGETSKEMVGRVVTIGAVEWAPFLSDRGEIPLAICKLVDEHGEVDGEFVTTSLALTMFIAKVQMLGLLPFRARIASKRTRSGREALNFERA